MLHFRLEIGLMGSWVNGKDAIDRLEGQVLCFGIVEVDDREEGGVDDGEDLGMSQRTLKVLRRRSDSPRKICSRCSQYQEESSPPLQSWSSVETVTVRRIPPHLVIQLQNVEMAEPFWRSRRGRISEGYTHTIAWNPICLSETCRHTHGMIRTVNNPR